jgi:hypothetical protein
MGGARQRRALRLELMRLRAAAHRLELQLALRDLSGRYNRLRTATSAIGAIGSIGSRLARYLRRRRRGNKAE